MGVAFNKEDDRQLYDKMKEAVDRIYRSSQDIAISVQKVAKEEKKPEPPKVVAKVATKSNADEGHCIRCNAQLPHDIDHPYCRTCYSNWKKQGGDSLAIEKHCHWCGKPNKSTLEKPECYDCYRKHLK